MADPYAGLGTPPQAAPNNPTQTQDPYAGLGTPPTQQAPKSSFANAPAALGGAAMSADLQGFGGHVAQWARETLDDVTHGGAYAQAQELSPGKSDDWYKQQVHMAYNSAMSTAQDQAQQQVQNNPYPGHTVGNFAAGVVGGVDPSYFIPMEGVGAKAVGAIASPLLQGAAKIGVSAGAHAILNSADDASYQLADIIGDRQKDFDVQRNLQAAAMGGAFGGAHTAISPFVSNLFKGRGVDTLPSEDPLGRTTPITGGQPTPEVSGPIHQAWQTGNEQDIYNAYNGTNITPPSHTEIHQYVQSRDNPEANPIDPPPLGQVDQRAAVQQHVDDITSGWKNAPPVHVINHIGDIEDPYSLEKAVDQGADHPSALGFHDPDTGHSYIFANKVQSPEDVSAVLYHEGLGHFGLQQKFGANLDSLLQTLDSRNVGQFGKDVDAELKANGSEYGGNRTRAAEEVLANMSEKGQMKPSVSDAVESTLRRFGRKMGMDLTYSDAEVRNILSMAHDSVINGNGRDARANSFKINRGYQPTDLSTNAEPKPLNHMYTDRGEVSDHSATMLNPRGDTLGTTMDHPDLYDRYPQLRDTPVIHSNLKETHGLVGGYDPEMQAIHLDHSANLSDAIHETQHAVQHIEGRISTGETNAHLSDEDYNKDPREIEAQKTEKRLYMTPEERFSADQDELKANPRFWSDPEYRKMVVEQGRTQNPGEVGKPQEAPQYRTEAEARAQGLNFMRRKDAMSSDYVSQDLERVYRALDEHYVPTTQTHEEAQAKALELGFKPSQIKEMGDTTKDLDVRVARLQAAANMADSRVQDIENRLGTPDQKVTDAMDYASALADFNYLAARVKGTKADIARALNISKTARSYTVATMAQVAERLKADGSGLSEIVGDPIKFMNFVNQIKALRAAGNQAGAHVLMAGVNKPYWEQYLTSFHFNAMLSSLSTHVKAPLDMMTGISHNVLDHTLAMPIGKVYNFVEGITGRSVKPGVSAEEVQGRVLGAIRSVFNHEVHLKTLQAAKTGDGSIVQPNGSSQPTSANATYGQASNARFTGLASPINIPMNLITAQDTLFRSVALGQELHGLGARQALQDFKAAGVKPTPDMIRVAGDAHAFNPTQLMLDTARSNAEKSLLLNPNKVTAWLGKMTSYKPGMSWQERVGTFAATNLAPFMRVASNSLITRTIERSPLPLVLPSTWRTLAAGGADAHLALSRMIYGTVKLGLLWGAADATKNALTGQGPSNTNKFKELEASGWRPNAVHENGQYNTGGTLNMSLNPFDLHNSTAQMVKDAHDAYDQAREDSAGKGFFVAAGNLMKAGLGTIYHDMEQGSWIHDMAPALEAADARGDGAGQTGASFVGQEAKTFVPGVLNQATRVMDPNEHDTRPDNPGDFTGSVINDVKSAIPGLAETLPIRYSVYGDPLQNGASVTGVHTAIPGLQGNAVQETTDPTKLELQRLAKLSPAAVVTPVQRTVQITDPTTGEKTPKKLTTAEFESYQQLAGVNIVDQVKQLMADPEWSSTPDKTKIAAVREVEKQVKQAAREQLFGN